METYLTDLIRLTHAATQLSAYPGTDLQFAQLREFANWFERQVREHENYYYSGLLSSPSPELQMPAIAFGPSNATLSSAPAVPDDASAWVQTKQEETQGPAQ